MHLARAPLALIPVTACVDQRTLAGDLSVVPLPFVAVPAAVKKGPAAVRKVIDPLALVASAIRICEHAVALPLAVVELTLIDFVTGERGLALTVHRAVLEATRVRERHLETVALLIGIG